MSGTPNAQGGARAPMRLSGPEVGQLRNLLREAFPRPRFEEFLLFRLNHRLDDYTSPADDYPSALRKVIQEANAALWWRDLVREARKAVPDDPALMEFGEGFGFSPATVGVDGGVSAPLRGSQLELKIRAAHSTYDVATWRRHLGTIEGRVCRIEYPAGAGQGTGFLVGPDIVLTCYHVIEPLLQPGAPDPVAAVAVRFDYKVTDDGVAVQAGTVHQLAQDWLADSSPYSQLDLSDDSHADPEPDELDYALLRLHGRPGEEPVGGATQDPDPVPRGWITVPVAEYDFAAQPALYIVQHPDGKPMQVALDTEAVIGLNGNGTRVRYTTMTEPGSSGSPCFGPDWQWVAVHHSGDPKFQAGGKPRFNQGIPVRAIRRLLTEHGQATLLGGA